MQRQRRETGQHRPHHRDQQEGVADLQFAPVAQGHQPGRGACRRGDRDRALEAPGRAVGEHVRHTQRNDHGDAEDEGDQAEHMQHRKVPVQLARTEVGHC
jgi:hypothetical protein